MVFLDEGLGLDSAYKNINGSVLGYSFLFLFHYQKQQEHGKEEEKKNGLEDGEV